MPAINSEATSGEIKDLIHSTGHNAPLAIIEYDDNQISMIPAPEGIRVGEKINLGKGDTTPGSVLVLENIPEGTTIYNIETMPGDGGKLVRSTGGFARVIAKTEKGIIIELPSKAQKVINPKCRAIIGIIAGSGRTEKPLMKAGNMYHKRKARNKQYPIVSGGAMNAVAHPHGGSSSSHKGRPTIARKNAPAGAKVGSIKPRRTGRRKGR